MPKRRQRQQRTPAQVSHEPKTGQWQYKLATHSIIRKSVNPAQDRDNILKNTRNNNLECHKSYKLTQVGLVQTCPEAVQEDKSLLNKSHFWRKEDKSPLNRSAFILCFTRNSGPRCGPWAEPWAKSATKICWKREVFWYFDLRFDISPNWKCYFFWDETYVLLWAVGGPDQSVWFID